MLECCAPNPNKTTRTQKSQETTQTTLRQASTSKAQQASLLPHSKLLLSPHTEIIFHPRSLLLRVRHAARGLVRLLDALAAGEQGLAVLGLLVLLGQAAAAAAARLREVGEAAALQVVLGAQVGALQRVHDERAAGHAGRGAEEDALTQDISKEFMGMGG